MNQDVIWCICGPSGVGKTTIINKFLNKYKDFTLIKSYTTRQPRGHNDNEYVFVTIEEFKTLMEQKFFIETECIFGNYYGTPKASNYNKCIFNVDIYGMLTLKTHLPVLSIFIAPPSIEILKTRLETRGELNLEARLNNAQSEINNAHKCNFRLINDDLQECFNKLQKIIIYKDYNSHSFQYRI